MRRLHHILYPLVDFLDDLHDLLLSERLPLPVPLALLVEHLELVVELLFLLLFILCLLLTSTMTCKGFLLDEFGFVRLRWWPRKVAADLRTEPK